MLLVLTGELHPSAAAEPAEVDLDAQLFRPTTGDGALVWADPSVRSASDPASARLLVHYAKSPLALERADGAVVPLLDDVLQADLLAATQWRLARLGVQLPVYLHQSGLAGSGPGLGPIALDARLGLVDPDRAPLGFGIGGRLFLPTDTVDTPLGTSSATGEITGALELRPGAWSLAVNGGWALTPEPFAAGSVDWLIARGGVARELGRGGLTLESAWRAPVPSIPLGTAGEWLLGGWAHIDERVRMRVAGGSGLTSGIGSPSMRLVTGVDWGAPRRPPDGDLDGLVDDADGCVDRPEDADGHEDGDGCPDLDDDLDGIADADDACPRDAEDRDDVQDGDGCPEPEVPVRLRVVDRRGDLVPLASASIDGRSPGMGADLYLELRPGTYHLAAQGEGYDGVAEDVVVAEGAVDVQLVLPVHRVQVDRALRFATDSATLLPESRAALAAVADTLLEHPEIEVLRIEGHTDARGDAVMNLHLSERRAASVRAYLVERGIAPERLVDQGYGESRPLDPRAAPEAWARNRRVELVVGRWAD